MENELNRHLKEAQPSGSDLAGRLASLTHREASHPELVMPSILYKLRVQEQSSDGARPSTNLLPYYRMPNKDIFNKWVMYLESIVKEVYSLDGTEGVLLEALNYQALSIYFAEAMEVFSPLSPGLSPLLPPSHRDSMASSRLGSGGHGGDMFSNYDRDQFSSVCSRIQEI